jgi:protein-S-isoprenylcysteine O-methyltransferase Ste14
VEDSSRGPGIRIPPPTYFALPMLTGFLVQHFVPIGIAGGASAVHILRLVGYAEVAIGLALLLWGGSTLLRSGATPNPMRPTPTLVQNGPFALTRNPMYLGLAVLYLGVTFAANALWPLVFLPEALALTYLFAIRLEESYLERAFGAAYSEYRARVRRWI